MLPPTLQIDTWLSAATRQLAKVGINSARLDSEVILANVLKKDRTYLHAHGDLTLDTKHRKIADRGLRSRLQRIPLAYITGYKEFYGRKFKVTPDTLVPRPESEATITLLNFIGLNPMKKGVEVVDIGTGSGCLGITAKLEHPELNVTLLDTSAKALAVAKFNATNLKAEVIIKQSDLLDNYKSQPNIIIANLPYVDKAWPRSPETDYEPAIALFADQKGLALVNKLIVQSAHLLLPGNYLILEADPLQHKAIISHGKVHGFRVFQQQDYCLAFQKV